MDYIKNSILKLKMNLLKQQMMKNKSFWIVLIILLGQCKNSNQEIQQNTYEISVNQNKIIFTPSGKFHISKAYNYIADNQIDKALTEIDSAMYWEPNNSLFYFEKAVCLKKKGFIKDAILSLDTAIILDPKYAYAYANRGFFHFLDYNDQKAMSDYQMAIELDSTIATVYYNMAMFYFDHKNFDKCCHFIKKAEHFGAIISKDDKLNSIKVDYCE
ncbi:MAG: hypothetical protein H6Q25_239 [Bacteroidetes bacterium]|nr:hypothetical protein [Bacteroidota bacterium]